MEGTRRSHEAAGRLAAARETVMFVFMRALTYATLFVAFLLVYVPANLLARFGIGRPVQTGWEAIAGLCVGTIGAMIAVWCIIVFVWAGKGTPAPFDPPRKLVIRGPYRFVRNPMYIGAGVALAGASLYYASVALLAYAAVFLMVCHVFVVSYEEPRLRRTFQDEYEAYCSRVRRWWPSA
jgi:protein-S-isoprenylcysteine O-methyltransferase Ste14